MLYRAAIILLCLFMAPTVDAQSAPPRKPDGRKTVGVISVIGDTFALQKIGIMVFGNDLKEASIQSWRIDDLVASKIGALLGKTYSVKRVPVPKGTFAAFEKPGALFRDRDAELQQIVRSLGGTHKSDLYIVVTRATIQYGNSNQFLTGLGLLEAGAPIYTNNVYLHALSVIGLYDGRSSMLIRQARASTGQSAFLTPVSGPNKKLDNSWWPPTPQAANNEKLKNATRDLVESSLAATVPDLMRAN